MSRRHPSMSELFDLTGKVALVTGGSGYLGTEICEALSEFGARVVIASRSLDKCEALAERLGSQHVAMQLDLTDESAVRGAVNKIFEDMGSLDILFNNGYSGTGKDLDNVTSDDFRQSYETGLISYFAASQQMVDHLRKIERGGCIINTGSMYGVVASYPEAYVGVEPNSPANYHALKGAVVHLTRHLAAYYAQYGVRVNCISPGPFPFPSTCEKYPEFIERLELKVPLKRIGQPWEIKGIALLLASEAGSYITGQNILVDGGWTAW